MSWYMKKRLLLVICIVIFSLSSLANSETVRLANGEYPPYCSEHLPHYGIWSHIVTEAFALKGLTVEYEFFHGNGP